MAIYANLTADQGSTFRATVNITDAEGNGLDISLYTYRGQVRKTYTSSTAVDFTVTAADAPAGEIELLLSDTQTGGMKAGRYLYDVEIISDGGEVTRVIEGQLEVTPRVTRTT